MDGRLPRAIGAAVVVASMLVQAAVCQGACICDVDTVAASAQPAHQHYPAAPASDTSGPAHGHDDHEGQASAVEPAEIALASCCCVKVGRGSHAPLDGGRPATLTPLQRGTTAPSTWTLAATVVPAQAAEVRARRLAPAASVARPPLILRI